MEREKGIYRHLCVSTKMGNLLLQLYCRQVITVINVKNITYPSVNVFLMCFLFELQKEQLKILGCLLIGWLNPWLDGIGCCFYKFILVAELNSLQLRKTRQHEETHCKHKFRNSASSTEQSQTELQHKIGFQGTLNGARYLSCAPWQVCQF